MQLVNGDGPLTLDDAQKASEQICQTPPSNLEDAKEHEGYEDGNHG